MASLAISTAGRSARAFHRRRINYDGPVVAVWGRDDRLVPCAHAPALLRALPQADVLIWDGMGHHPQRERSAQLLEAVERSARGTEAHGEQALAA